MSEDHTLADVQSSWKPGLRDHAERAEHHVVCGQAAATAEAAPGSSSERQTSGPTPDLVNQKVKLHRMPRQSACTFMSEKQRLENHLVQRLPFTDEERLRDVSAVTEQGLVPSDLSCSFQDSSSLHYFSVALQLAENIACFCLPPSPLMFQHFEYTHRCWKQIKKTILQSWAYSLHAAHIMMVCGTGDHASWSRSGSHICGTFQVQ